MNSFNNTEAHGESEQSRTAPPSVLASAAGVPFQPSLGKASGIDPFTEWLSLMEVVQMLCPVWPVRNQPMQGDHWRL
jgi:hypothetical protein